MSTEERKTFADYPLPDYSLLTSEGRKNRRLLMRALEEQSVLPVRGKLLFTSRGLNTKAGAELIGNALKDDELSVRNILLILVPGYEIDTVVIKSCEQIGFKRHNIVLASQSDLLDQEFNYVYCTEGNTFEVADFVRRNGLEYVIRKNVGMGATYIGASAGAFLAGTDFELASDFDSNFLRMYDFRGLALFDGIVIPHFEPEELSRYIENTASYRIEKYKRIFSVENEEIICI